MPVVTMIAGPNGSGKSTLARALFDLGFDFGEYLNADDIAAGLSGAPEVVAARAQHAVRDARTKALAEVRSHCFETVLSHPSHLDHLQACKDQGFEVWLFFVATDDPLISMGRVANRVLHGGHDVPADRIIARYHRSIGNLPAAIAICNYARIFDNSTIKDALRPVAEFVNGKYRKLIPTKLPDWWSRVAKEMKIK
jgi:predicted ABC-type ATPase